MRKWLKQQPFETTKVLQALLYIGRDEDVRDGTTAQEVYNNQRTSLDKTGWNALDIEVRQITGKADAVEQIRISDAWHPHNSLQFIKMHGAVDESGGVLRERNLAKDFFWLLPKVVSAMQFSIRLMLATADDLDVVT